MTGSHMTLEDIRRAWPDEYVVLVDVDVDDESLLVRGGAVAAYGKSRREALEAAVLPPGTGWALEYTGRPDADYLMHLKVG